MSICDVDTCQRKAWSRGMCGMHYQRWHRNGDPSITKVANRRPAAERFWEKVDISRGLGCWLWTGTLMGKGYGQFWDGKRMIPAHRWAYEAANGPIPTDMQLDHVAARGCSHKHCVNPTHLEVVDNRTNSLRGNSVSAINARKTHCPHGHPFAGDNLRVVNGTRRVCRTCEREAGRRYKAKMRHQTAGRSEFSDI